MVRFARLDQQILSDQVFRGREGCLIVDFPMLSALCVDGSFCACYMRLRNAIAATIRSATNAGNARVEHGLCPIANTSEFSIPSCDTWLVTSYLQGTIQGTLAGYLVKSSMA